MIEFINKAMDWVLQKEQDAANECSVKVEDVQKQLDKMEEKKSELETKYKDEIKEINHIISRLTLIKASATRCGR